MSRKQIALALQGGGSHGAYTWGVLDRLLQDDQLIIEGISGASAGAVNAVVLAHGYTTGGREGARAALAAFWNAVGPYKAIAPTPSLQLPDPASRGYLFLTRFFSPYQLNPLNINPLRDILSQQVDFERLRADSTIKLFIAATRVSDGRLKIFSTSELTLDTLLASACIPSVHHSVEIDGVAYWDGGLAGNPPLSVLLHECRARDMLVVVLNPSGGDAIPSTADAIGERLTQISFRSTLATELDVIALAKAEAERARFPLGRLDRRLRNLNLHLIDSGAYLAEFAPASRFNTEAGFIAALRDEGRRRADAWLGKNVAALGSRSTFEWKVAPV